MILCACGKVGLAGSDWQAARSLSETHSGEALQPPAMHAVSACLSPKNGVKTGNEGVKDLPCHLSVASGVQSKCGSGFGVKGDLDAYLYLLCYRHPLELVRLAFSDD